MSAGEGEWTVRLAGAAEVDFEAIIAWTLQQFGDVQAGIYAETLSSAVQALVAGPAQLGIKARPEIGRSLFTLHVARNGRRGRHFVLFRADADPVRRQVDVLRILHDSMDLARHVPAAE
ncbi:MAG TPA: type II toxin-antitoxin system RelE/ParE family toxin [Steroidobacteraceae bacterium]|nr:type II toxin-antitoxin system RelE/ParE family toxin [Steroidobacteraceae bacterium]